MLLTDEKRQKPRGGGPGPGPRRKALQACAAPSFLASEGCVWG